MLKYLWKSSGPVVPILYIDANINQIRTANLLKKIRNFKYDFAKGIAIVCSIQNCMPVQVDKILQQVQRVKQKHNIPVYGFLQNKCSPENYYMVSIANQIYSLPETIFQLQRKQHTIQWDSLLAQYHIKKIVLKSNQNLSGKNLDSYTSPNTIQFINRRDTQLSETLYKQSIRQRLSTFWYNRQIKTTLKSKIHSQMPKYPFLGDQALKLGLIDNFGQHYKIIKQKHPDCHIEVIKFLDEPRQFKKGLAILTSPILLGLFIFKVFLKYSIIMYIYFKSKSQGKSDKVIEAQIQQIKEKY